MWRLLTVADQGGLVTPGWIKEQEFASQLSQWNAASATLSLRVAVGAQRMLACFLPLPRTRLPLAHANLHSTPSCNPYSALLLILDRLGFRPNLLFPRQERAAAAPLNALIRLQWLDCTRFSTFSICQRHSATNVFPFDQRHLGASVAKRNVLQAPHKPQHQSLQCQPALFYGG